jgi:serine/threonine-protein kinase
VGSEDLPLVPAEAEHAGVTPAHKVEDIGRYRLIAELARGGMGIVYLALVRGPGGFNKLMVVKVLKSHLAEDPKLVTMFLEEARLAAKLSHPNVVQTIEVGTDARRQFIAMEFLDGQSLYRALARGKRIDTPMPLRHQLQVIHHLLEGLHYAHGVSDFDGTVLNIVHRDVSPQNVFLTYDGQVKILDFGIAKALDSSSDTRTGMLKGKVSYMAPEQAAGEPIDGRADLFSVGVMLWEAAVGKRMWDRALNDLQILHSLVNGAIPRPRVAHPEIDAHLEHIILKATSVQPAARYASALEMQTELEACMRELGPESVTARDLGKYVGDLFVEERAHLKGVVDGQIRLLRSTASGDYARIDMATLSPPAAAPATPSGSTERGVDVEVSYQAPLSPPPRPRRSVGTIVALVILAAMVLGAGGAVALLFLRGSDGSRALQTSTATAAAASALPPPTQEASATGAAPVGSSVASASTSQVAASPLLSASPPASALPVAPRTVWGPRPVATPQSSAPAVTTAAAPAPTPSATQPTATATATAHVRQQIDTSNPYSH